MVHNIQRLLYLCHLKNELNRKRRRFYYYMYSGVAQYKSGQMKKRKHIGIERAREGYRKAQQEMRAMTREMSAMRLEMGARLVWTNHGAIGYVDFNGKRVPKESFKSYYEAELFEMGIFKR